MIAPALLSAQSNEWYTPAKYVEAARLVMGSIELDPASCEDANRTVKAKRIFTLENGGGLGCFWQSEAVWLNPPYSNVKEWINELIDEHTSGRTQQAILLVNASTSEKWFQPLWDYPICFTNHRIKFDCPGATKSQPTKGNAFVYFGENSYKFAKVFSQFGTVVRKVTVC
jgi:phage N-6-adenine-methyltransferase